MAQAPGSDAEKVAALRELLPATGAGIYLDTASAGPLPAESAAAMREADERDLHVGRAAAGREEDVAQRAEEARAVIAALLTADPAEVTLRNGLADALAGAVWAADLRPGDRVLTTNLEATGTYTVLQALRDRWRIHIDVADGGVGRDSAVMFDALDAALTDRTRLLVASHLAASSGAVLPIRRIAERARARGALVVVDGSQAAGALALDASALGADYVFLATDTWLLGPEGSAALWAAGRTARADRRPFPEPQALPRTSLVGLARSVGWLEMYVGLEWALERGQRVARWTADRLAQFEGVELLTPRERMGGIVTFRLPAWSAAEAVDELGRRVFAIVRALPALEAVRASVAWFNTEEELERFVAAVGELSIHTPATLPARPKLTIL
jgi:L-cysteine/cystine lyase